MVGYVLTWHRNVSQGILVKTPEGLSDIILKIIIIDVPVNTKKMPVMVVAHSLLSGEPDKLIEGDDTIPILVNLTDQLLQLHL